MEPIQFESLVELLAVELGLSNSEIHDAFESDSPDLDEKIDDAFKLKFFEYKLSEPIYGSDGKQVLMAPGTDLKKKLSAVVSRQKKDPDAIIGPIFLVADAAMVDHYKRLIGERLSATTEKMKSDPGPVVKRVLHTIKPEMRQKMHEVVKKAVEKVYGTSYGIVMMLQIIRTDGFDKRWKGSLDAAYTAMAMAAASHELAEEGETLPSVEKVGTAAVLQDFAILLKPGLYKNDVTRHAMRSMQIAQAMGFDEEVMTLIEQHHSYLKEVKFEEPSDSDEDGEKAPVPVKGMSEEARNLVVANLFIGSITDNPKRGSDIQAIKGLNFLMAEGKVDKRAVVTLTRLFLSHKFALFFEKATEIQSHCPHEWQADAVLWNILGERNPQKFICKYKDCVHLGSQQTMVSQNIPITFDGKVVAKIPRGTYYSCRYLTNELAELYKEVSKLSTK